MLQAQLCSLGCLQRLTSVDRALLLLAGHPVGVLGRQRHCWRHSGTAAACHMPGHRLRPRLSHQLYKCVLCLPARACLIIQLDPPRDALSLHLSLGVDDHTVCNSTLASFLSRQIAVGISREQAICFSVRILSQGTVSPDPYPHSYLGMTDA